MNNNNNNNYTENFNKVLLDLNAGKPFVLVDDEDREFEGDLVIAAEKADKYNLIFMMRHARGLMCIPCFDDVLKRLDIPMMRNNQLDKFGTPFTVSVDSVHGTTGMSVYDRLKTISVFVNPKRAPSELAQPGHLFPLRARPGLLKERRGHTESSLELVKAANLTPVSIIVEIMNDDGTMAKGQQLIDYSKIYNLNIISINEIYKNIYEQ